MVLWGYNPYIMNTIHRHQPFYPVLGSAKYPSLIAQGKEGIELYETPKNLLGRNRLVRFAYATFGRPGNQPYVIGENAPLMWPFTARWADLYAYTYHETRVAGFGPCFSGAILLSLGLGVRLLVTQPGMRAPLVLIVGTIVASLLISVHIWWARYGPQFWLLALVPLVFTFKLPGFPRLKRFAWALRILFFVNATVVGAVGLKWETTASLRPRR